MATRNKPKEEAKAAGRPPCFAEPEDLWKAFEAYEEITAMNPILQHDFVGKDGNSVERRRNRPLTMEGFENYCFRKFGFGSDLADYFRTPSEEEIKTGTHYTRFSSVCSRIKSIIRQNQIEGGMVGDFNPSITQRLNGLVEKTSNENNNTNTNYEVSLDLNK